MWWDFKKFVRVVSEIYKKELKFQILNEVALILLVFSVSLFLIDQNKNQTVQYIKSRIWEMKGGTYTKTLAKIQGRGIFPIRDIRRNVLLKLIEICMETPWWCSPGWAPTWRPETNRNICYRVLLQKRENQQYRWWENGLVFKIARTKTHQKWQCLQMTLKYTR